MTGKTALLQFILTIPNIPFKKLIDTHSTMTRLLQAFLLTLSLAHAHSSLRGSHAKGTLNDEFFLDPAETDYNFRKLQELESTQRFHVPLVLSLKYLNNTIATELETLDPTNPLIHSFCTMVQKQAAGNQVKRASVQVGITITTATNALDCTIIGTHRVYRHTAGPEYFTLDLNVIQVVTATTLNTLETLTLDVVQDLTKIGFNRGLGGRAMFLALLQSSSPAFLGLLDIAVMDQFTSDPPTASPTLASTTQNPSISPSALPTTLPSTTLLTASPSVLEQPTASPSSGMSSAFPTALTTDTLSTMPSKSVSYDPTIVTAWTKSPSVLSDSPSISSQPTDSSLPSETPSEVSTPSIEPLVVTRSAALDENTVNDSPTENKAKFSAIKIAFIIFGSIVALVIFQVLCGCMTRFCCHNGNTDDSELNQSIESQGFSAFD